MAANEEHLNIITLVRSLNYWQFIPTFTEYGVNCLFTVNLGKTATLKKTKNWFSRPIIA